MPVTKGATRVPGLPLRLHAPTDREAARQALYASAWTLRAEIRHAGFEPHVLESIRSLWPVLGDVLTEVQPHAWKFHNLSVDSALGTFRDLILFKQYAIVTLPHTTLEERREANWNVSAASHLDVCSLPVHRGKARSFVPTVGLRTAEVLDYDGFAILGKTPEQIKAQASASRALPVDRGRTGRQNAPPLPNASPGGGGGGGGGGPIWNHDKGRVHPSHLYFPGSGYAPDALDPFSASNMDRTGRGGALRARPMPPQSHIRSSMSPDELARRVNYIDRRFLNEFLTERGSIVPRRRTGFSVKMQRALKREIKIAKSMALLSPLSKLSLDRRGR